MCEFLDKMWIFALVCFMFFYLVPWSVGARAINCPVFSKCSKVDFPALSNPINKNLPFFSAIPNHLSKNEGKSLAKTQDIF